MTLNLSVDVGEGIISKPLNFLTFVWTLDLFLVILHLDLFLVILKLLHDLDLDFIVLDLLRWKLRSPSAPQDSRRPSMSEKE